ncbi:oxygen-insensitive NAD(P)H nitroreductase / Dihydropteridine reductase [Halarchaeum acidiphilum MH1-52-1]|uniref:Oxygen-insensitive NAD(P)H nitroreductase / Dihydropteridine reductase n=1 Tax=Halarchaeum acidiphilum MH1-52-1 TaxID=1261545 RepID=U3A7G6_9EURY|nr:nitroreductase family protein [Halarchaeum acidiphilum]GAD53629.1 oxygen-insensitive NAD(P)H nitroreductase / Dihydropteridine reductase [Halarchaeum acidiphilum MH1-52-1]
MTEQTFDADTAPDAQYPDAVEAIRTRRSGHNFDPDGDVAEETLREIVRDATLAPSAFNLQPWEFVAVRDEERLDDLVDLAYGQEHLRDAGTGVVVVGHTDAERTAERVYNEWAEAGRISEEDAADRIAQAEDDDADREFAVRNASLAAENFLLSAHARGLKATPMTGFDFEGVDEFLGLPDDLIPVVLIALGESGGDEPERLPRRSVDDVLHVDDY